MDEGIDTTAVYRDTRLRIRGLVTEADGAGDTIVPACPSWRVRDVVAHLTGVCDDILTGNLDGVATDPWTQAQVERRAERPLAEVIEEWDDVGPRVEALFGPGGALPQLVFDEVTHEHDLRGALRRPGARDDVAVDVGLGFLVEGMNASFGQGDLPAVRVCCRAEEWVLGEGEPAVTVTASAFDLLRSFSGRRTIDQIAALDWSDDPARWFAAFTFGPFTVPAEPVE